MLNPNTFHRVGVVPWRARLLALIGRGRLAMSSPKRGKSSRHVRVACFKPPAAAPFCGSLGCIMLNLETVVGDYSEVLSLSEALGAFSVALFFSILRAEGCSPFVRDGGLYTEFRNSAAARDAGKWAALHDPTGHIRMEYVREAWTARRSGIEVVELG